MKKLFDPNIVRKWEIYKIENPAGQVYIGCSCKFTERIRAYKNINCVKQTTIYKSLLAYGYDAHSVTIIDSFSSNYEYAQGKEMFWVRSFMSNRNRWLENNGMNETDGGAGGLGKPVKKETLAKRLAYFEKNPRVFTEEMRQRFSDVHKGKPSSFKGKHHTEENKRAASISKSLERGRRIIQYDLSGNKMNEFLGIRIAHRETGISRTTIKEHLNGVTKTPKNYIFKYA